MDPIEKMLDEAAKNPKMRRKLKVKALLSLVLFFVFLLALFTAIGMLWATKNGAFLGMTKAQIFALRTKVALIMNILIIAHIIVNRKVFVKELKILFG
ncbi:hypothetical protein [Thermococcus barophilus]|uniref:DUF4405 domain-containing protein n=2 Tax=Thermococcus barophilus TaxID=55802 RepID=A0A0S1X9W7_THEBA|nr:hypothetical protein [Thermococcus barophilus]ADT83536.1 hypothetical protein TERMP_00559 [Thermococcus barophilus MP]ALM74579.1 conserved exported hypothetical protein [Thermococcus barophilus]